MFEPVLVAAHVSHIPLNNRRERCSEERGGGYLESHSPPLYILRCHANQHANILMFLFAASMAVIVETESVFSIAQ